MIPSTLFAIVTASSLLIAVNGAIIQRDGTFTFLTPQPTVPTTTASTTATTTSNVTPPLSAIPPTTSSSRSLPTTTSSTTATVTSTTTTSPTTTSSTTSATVIPPITTSKTVPIPTGTTSTTSTQSTGTTTLLPPTVTKTSTSPSPSGIAGAGANCNGIQQWQASFAYTAGNQVIFNGQLFTARQWTYNNAPPTHPDQWTAGGVCAQPINNQANCNGVAAWESIVAYTTGNHVTFNGHLWSAVQWTQSNVPGDTSGSWKDLGACA